MKKLLALLLCMAMLTTVLVGCSSSDSSDDSDDSAGTESVTLTLSGSTSMESINKALGEAFSLVYDNVTVDVQGGGSSAGYTNAVDGTSDIGCLSRNLKDDETEVTEHIVAIDGIAIVINSANSVDGLTTEQIAAIYTGEITNWSEVGGDDMEIVVIGREAGSGTRDGFESIIGVEDLCVYDSELSETGVVKTTVASTAGAIGYISLGYADDTVKAITVDGVEATEETVKDGTYAVQRNFLMVVANDSTNEWVETFIEYALSDEGQAIVSSKGFVAVG